MTQKDIADVIQGRLLEYDMTTSELASHAGVTFETASRVKKNGIGYVETIEKLLDVLDMELNIEWRVEE